MKAIFERTVQQTITLKMSDQERSDFYVVFTIILCGFNFLSGEL